MEPNGIAFRTAAKDGNLSILEKYYKDDQNLVFEAGAKSGKTALHYAAESASLETVQWLVERKADPQAKDINGQTPYQIALLKQKRDIFVYFYNWIHQKDPHLRIEAEEYFDQHWKTTYLRPPLVFYYSKSEEEKLYELFSYFIEDLNKQGYKTACFDQLKNINTENRLLQVISDKKMSSIDMALNLSFLDPITEPNSPMLQSLKSHFIASNALNLAEQYQGGVILFVENLLQPTLASYLNESMIFCAYQSIDLHTDFFKIKESIFSPIKDYKSIGSDIQPEHVFNEILKSLKQNPNKRLPIIDLLSKNFKSPEVDHYRLNENLSAATILTMLIKNANSVSKAQQLAVAHYLCILQTMRIIHGHREGNKRFDDLFGSKEKVLPSWQRMLLAPLKGDCSKPMSMLTYQPLSSLFPSQPLKPGKSSAYLISNDNPILSILIRSPLQEALSKLTLSYIENLENLLTIQQKTIRFQENEIKQLRQNSIIKANDDIRLEFFKIDNHDLFKLQVENAIEKTKNKFGKLLNDFIPLETFLNGLEKSLKEYFIARSKKSLNTLKGNSAYENLNLIYDFFFTHQFTFMPDKTSNHPLISEINLLLAIIYYDLIVALCMQHPNPDPKTKIDISNKLVCTLGFYKISHRFADKKNDLSVTTRKALISKIMPLIRIYNDLWLGFNELEWHISENNKKSAGKTKGYHGQVIYNLESYHIDSRIDQQCLPRLSFEMEKIKQGVQPRTQFIIDVFGQAHAILVDIEWDSVKNRFNIICVEPGTVFAQIEFLLLIQSIAGEKSRPFFQKVNI